VVEELPTRYEMQKATAVFIKVVDVGGDDKDVDDGDRMICELRKMVFLTHIK